jgi:hypothetical protein
MIEIPAGTQPRTERVAIVLAELMALTATTKERRAGHLIPVPSRYWRSLIGSRYKDTLREALDRGYIEVNDRYSVGRFSKSYRLAQKYRHPKTVPYLCDNSRRCSRIRITDHDHVGRALVAQFSSVRLPGNPGGWDGYCASQIRRGAYYAVRCQYGRFHSSFTGLKREVRSTLTTVDGEPLVEIDVKNCQPLIVGILAARQHSAHRRHPTHPTHTPYIICGASSDVQTYLDLCERGQLYEHLLQRSGHLTVWDCVPPDRRHRFAEDRPLNRDDIKRQFLVMLFADAATTRQIRLFDIVRAEFPTIAEFVVASKRDRHQDLAHKCQRMESRLIIDGACGACFRACPETVLVTVHDAVMTTREYADMAACQIVAEFQRFGVSPSLSQPIKH